MRHSRCLRWVGGIVWFAGAAASAQQELPVVDELHLIGGCVVDLGPFDLGQVRGVTPAPVITILNNGPSSNRVDLVFVGDGYLATQMATYSTHVNNALNALFAQEPFQSYKPLFNAHRVTVVSPESGVDHDPVYPTWRSTALDMFFFCGGTERLLCVSVSKAYDYALNAPEVDQVFAVANSTKYGGAGYTAQDLCTYSGGNASSPEVAIHELGHSLGDLADEYWTIGDTYVGPERPEVNVSIFNAAQIGAMQTKWWRWLNVNDGMFDQSHTAYLGGFYNQFGIYRPTNNSKMRNLGRPFNLVSVEGLIKNIYLEVDPIDDAAPNGAVVPAATTLWVDPIDPLHGHLSVQWLVEGAPIPGATGLTFTPSVFSLTGQWTISVRVVDNTPWVRDPAIRDAYMTSVRSWTVAFTTPGDVNGDGMVTFADVNIVLSEWLETGPGLTADVNGDGIVNFGDLNIVLSNFGAGA